MTTPRAANKVKLVQTMIETFAWRREQIRKDSQSITAIIKEYPRLLDFEGEMVSRVADQFEIFY
jgi:hypothetical protein